MRNADSMPSRAAVSRRHRAGVDADRVAQVLDQRSVATAHGIVERLVLEVDPSQGAVREGSPRLSLGRPARSRTVYRFAVDWDLTLTPALDRPELLAEPVRATLAADPALASTAQVAEIDPELADTAAFCARYGVGLAESANCVLVSGKRGGEVRMAAAVVLADTRADVNGVIRRAMDVRKLSFASRETATSESGMEYGGITPIGLPQPWPVYVAAGVAAAERAVIGSGLRRSKLVLPGAVLAAIPGAVVLDDLAVPV